MCIAGAVSGPFWPVVGSPAPGRYRGARQDGHAAAAPASLPPLSLSIPSLGAVVGRGVQGLRVSRHMAAFRVGLVRCRLKGGGELLCVRWRGWSTKQELSFAPSMMLRHGCPTFGVCGGHSGGLGQQGLGCQGSAVLREFVFGEGPSVLQCSLS